MKTILYTKDLAKSYGNFFALNDINFKLKKGTIHAVIGENGSGKTTLIKLITGLEEPTSGKIFFEDASINYNFEKIQAQGVKAIYQEINLVACMNVVENVFLDKKENKPINFSHQLARIERFLNLLDFDIDPFKKISEMDLATQRMVEIVKLLNSDAKIFLLDEVTSYLTDMEVEKFHKVLKKLCKAGFSIVYISHKLNEVLSLADEITILRNGQQVITLNKPFSINSIISYMSKESFVNRYPKIQRKTKRELLRLESVSDGSLLQDISLTLNKGELLGITGLAGSGRSALAQTIAGIRGTVSGTIYIEGEKVKINSIKDAQKNRIAYGAESISSQLVDHMSVSENITLSRMSGVLKKGIIDTEMERRIAREYTDMLGFTNVNIHSLVKHLSMGTQYKVLISKLLYSNAKIFVLNDVTKNLDIISRMKMYNILNEIMLENIGIIFISSNIDELIGMCNKLLVLYKGRIVAEIQGNELHEERIVGYATGLS